MLVLNKCDRENDSLLEANDWADVQPTHLIQLSRAPPSLHLSYAPHTLHQLSHAPTILYLLSQAPPNRQILTRTSHPRLPLISTSRPLPSLLLTTPPTNPPSPRAQLFYLDSLTTSPVATVRTSAVDGTGIDELLSVVEKERLSQPSTF